MRGRNDIVFLMSSLPQKKKKMIDCDQFSSRLLTSPIEQQNRINEGKA